ncbi:protein ELC-like [Amaranthus tricolor]|uniref:protein ELC-like n=1 Tax=Amaranthus tricolor TaxID=29722 RepID=UPI002590D135|nr:protein ELC-like [Amaranthus tricolor]
MKLRCREAKFWNLLGRGRVYACCLTKELSSKKLIHLVETSPMAPPPHPLHVGDSNPQIRQFLSNVLSQRGPLSPPYTEDVKWLIRQHLISLTEVYPSLQPKTATFNHNDGRTINLLQAEGTIPMVYQGVTYNIPVVIWLMELYPRQPPCVFVNPTRDMIIKRPHPYVTPSGIVSIPYLQKWIYPSSNLVDLVRDLSHYFGRDPPLYSQRKSDSNSNHNLNVNANPNPSHTSLSGNSMISSNTSYSGSIASGSVAHQSMPPRVFPPSPYVGSGRSMSPSPQRQNGTDDPNEVYKRNAISKLVESVHSDVVALRKTREAEMEGLFSAQAILRQREEQLNKGLKEMFDEKEALEQQLQLVLTNADVLEGWLKDNEEKMSKMGNHNVDVDDAFEHCDTLSKQMIESSASDLAIEDVIYSLDKAVQDGVIPFDQYLRNVRLLSREQFFHRATAAKVRAAQMQAHVASMAARSSQYVM